MAGTNDTRNAVWLNLGYDVRRCRVGTKLGDSKGGPISAKKRIETHRCGKGLSPFNSIRSDNIDLCIDARLCINMGGAGAGLP